MIIDNCCCVLQLASMLKLPKFEVDLPVIPKPPKLCLFDRDVTMANLLVQPVLLCLDYDNDLA